MGLSHDIIQEFVRITNDKTEKEDVTSVNGVISIDEKGNKLVRLGGKNSDAIVLTPVDTVADVKDGDVVKVEIKDHKATVVGNVTSPSASTDDVKQNASKIESFDNIIAYRLSTTELSAAQANINDLKALLIKVDELQAGNADIENLLSKFADIGELTADDISAINASITNLKATLGTFESISTEDLAAANAYINFLTGLVANFKYATITELTAEKAKIEELDTTKLDAEQAKLTYANIDFSNIGEAAITKLFTDSGIIKDLIVSEGHITGELVGVTIKGDIIEGGTVKADKLVVKGSDGLFYKLNTDGVSTTAEQTEYNSLDGSVITAKSITAEKVNVDDLVAFDATIGGLNITDGSIYSGVKSSIDNTTKGFYLDKDGQLVVGDTNNFIKYYKDQNGNYKLEISANNISIRSGETTKSVESAIEEIETKIDTIKDEITTLLRIESSRGTVFKNDTVATVLSVVIYHGKKRITNSSEMKETFGNGAYLQWKWQRLDDDSFGVISSSDSRFGDNGFTFTLSPEDVDTKITFMCELIV